MFLMTDAYFRPIKSSLSSQQGLYSNPVRYVTSGYATVSERTIKTVAVPNIQKCHATDNQPCCSYFHENSHYLPEPGTLRTSNLRSTRSELTNKVHNHLLGQKHSSGAVSDGEYMYSSDVEPNHYCTTPSRYKQNTSLKQLNKKPEEVNNKESESHDPLISLSLPDVLGEDVHLVCRDLDLSCECPPKSISGDNFLEMQQNNQEMDNVSEGSYRISDHEPHSQHSGSSRPSEMPQESADTYFEAIVKRTDSESVRKAIYADACKTTEVISLTPKTPQTQDTSEHETKTTESLLRKTKEPEVEAPEQQFSTSAPSALFIQKELPTFGKGENRAIKRNQSLEEKRRHGDTIFQDGGLELSTILSHSKDQPNDQNLSKRYQTLQQFPQKAIISPLVSSTSKAQVIYTSRGTILQKPKVIYDEGDDKDHTGVKKKHSSIEKKVGQPQSTPKTYGATGPLPGKVITRESIVIAADSTKKPKPAVPPKPKYLSDMVAAQQSQTTAASTPHAVVNLQDEELSSSLHQASTRTSSLPSQRPTVIAIQSEDAPDIQKCHLLNSDIPYVLTVRKITTDGESKPDSPFSTFKDPVGKQALSDAIAGNESATIPREKSKSPDVFNRRKSLDLVQRKRLPSPGSFSSQDHSISPTSLDSGDVLEYLLRRRSASNERSSLAKRGKRGDLRRQTQPVRFNLPPSPDVEQQRPSSVSQPNLQDRNDDEFNIEEPKVSDDQSVSESRSTGFRETIDGSNLIGDEEVFPPVPEFSPPPTAKPEDESAVAENSLPPPPATPPLPPPPLLITSAQSVRPTSFDEPPLIPPSLSEKTAEFDESVPFADESFSPRSSLVQSEDFSETQQKSQNTATLRTPTGLLWTDF